MTNLESSQTNTSNQISTVFFLSVLINDCIKIVGVNQVFCHMQPKVCFRETTATLGFYMAPTVVELGPPCFLLSAEQQRLKIPIFRTSLPICSFTLQVIFMSILWSDRGKGRQKGGDFHMVPKKLEWKSEGLETSASTKYLRTHTTPHYT